MRIVIQRYVGLVLPLRICAPVLECLLARCSSSSSSVLQEGGLSQLLHGRSISLLLRPVSGSRGRTTKGHEVVRTGAGGAGRVGRLQLLQLLYGLWGCGRGL